MTICHERKLIFIHIPKNAGTSIIKAMVMEDENIYMDKKIQEYKEHYDEYWDKYKKFTVIRDPIDRFISAYKFARMKDSGWFSATGEEGLKNTFIMNYAIRWTLMNIHHISIKIPKNLIVGIFLKQS